MAGKGRPALGVGIVGDGLMAKEHSMAWRNVQAVYGDVPVEPRLAMIMHPDEDRARAAAQRYGVERWTTSWEELVADPEVDVVDIVTPNTFHKDVAIAASRARKHIWCEKPLAVTADDAAQMTEAAEAAGVQTLLGFTYLHNPALALAKSLIAEGELGEIVSFTGSFTADTMIDPDVPFSWRLDRSRAGGGAFADLGSHLVSIARYLVGDISKVNGMSRIVVPTRMSTEKDGRRQIHKVDNDDVTVAMIEFAAGAFGSLFASRVATGRAFEVAVTVTGTRGSVRFSQQDEYKLEAKLGSDPFDPHGYRTIEVGPGHGDFGHLWPMSGINVGLHELKIFEVRRLIDAIVRGEPADPDFRAGLEIQRVIEAVERSAQSGSWESAI